MCIDSAIRWVRNSALLLVAMAAPAGGEPTVPIHITVALTHKVTGHWAAGEAESARSPED